MHNLFVDFTCRKRTRETRSTCCTESTAHSTSSLRGSADRELVTIWHTDTFNRGTIRITKQVFTTSVLRNLTNNLLSTSKNYLFRQLFSQCFWEVTHLIKRSSTLRPNPFFNLFCTEFWLIKRSHQVKNLFRGKASKVRFSGSFLWSRIRRRSVCAVNRGVCAVKSII